MGAKASLPYDGPPANLGWDIPPGALGLSLGAGRGNTNTHRSCSALLWGNKRDLWVSFLKSLQPLLLLEVIGLLSPWQRGQAACRAFLASSVDLT